MAWIFYIIYVLIALKSILCAVGGFTILGYGIYSIISYCEQSIKPKIKIFVISSIVLFIGILFPPQRVIYTMLGVHCAEQVITNETTQQLADDTIEIISLYLEQTKDKLKQKENTEICQN